MKAKECPAGHSFENKYQPHHELLLLSNPWSVGTPLCVPSAKEEVQAAAAVFVGESSGPERPAEPGAEQRQQETMAGLLKCCRTICPSLVSPSRHLQCLADTFWQLCSPSFSSSHPFPYSGLPAALVSPTKPSCPACSPLSHWTHQLPQVSLLASPFSRHIPLQLTPVCWMPALPPTLHLLPMSCACSKQQIFLPLQCVGAHWFCMLFAGDSTKACEHIFLSRLTCWTHIDHSRLSWVSSHILGTFTLLSEEVFVFHRGGSDVFIPD